MTSMLLISFLLGMRHAIESDHVAAVASLAVRRPTLRHAVRQGVVWGVGHTLTLFVACSAVLFLGRVMPERAVAAIEAAVGLMLVLLGLDVLRRLWRERIHFHMHRHGTVRSTCTPILTRASAITTRATIATRIPRAFPLRALCIGMVHGLALARLFV